MTITSNNFQTHPSYSGPLFVALVRFSLGTEGSALDSLA